MQYCFFMTKAVPLSDNAVPAVRWLFLREVNLAERYKVQYKIRYSLKNNMHSRTLSSKIDSGYILYWIFIEEHILSRTLSSKIDSKYIL